MAVRLGCGGVTVGRWLGPGAVVLAALVCAAPLRAADEASTKAPVTDAPPTTEARRPNIAPPRARDTSSPPYPENAHGDSVVVLELVVERDGSVGEIRVVRGDDPFASAALAAAKLWRFDAARRDEQPIAARIRIEVRFTESQNQSETDDEEPLAPEVEPESKRHRKGSEPISEVTVRGFRPVAPKTSLRRSEVREIPGTFGDPFRAIEVNAGSDADRLGPTVFFRAGGAARQRRLLPRRDPRPAPLPLCPRSLGHSPGPDGTESGVSSQFHRIDGRWDRRIDAATRLRTAMTFGWDATGSAQTSDVDIGVENHMFATRLELEHRASPRVLLRAGADAVLDRAVVSLQQETEAAREAPPMPSPMTTMPGQMPPSSESEEEPTNDDDIELLLPTRTDVTLGVRGDAVIEAEPGITVTPGLRVDFYHSQGASAVGIDPRIAARFDVSRAVSLEHSLGIVHQPPSFVIPLPGFELSDLRGGLQRSVQSSAGVEWRLPKEWVTTLTLYQNAFFNLTDILSFVRYGDELEDLGYRSRALGHSYGLEFVLRRPLTRAFGGYLAYTLSRSDRSLSRLRRPSSFDRTHVLHAAAAYDLGKRWRLGSRVTFYTGNPSSVRVGDRLVSSSGEPEVQRDPPPLHERAPAFFRVDMRVEKRWLIGSSGAWISFVSRS